MGCAGDEAADRLAVAMVNRLIRDGHLIDHRWRDALAELPWHRFVPWFYEPPRGNGPWQRVRAEDPAHLDRVYGGGALITELSELDIWGRQEPVSASPPVSTTVRSLQALDLHDGMTAVEIGAGTGHTTALLAHRLGGRNVTGIEIDPDLLRFSEHILAEQHVRSRIVLADGLDPRVIEAADRVLVGYEASFVPPSWIEGVRPGGMLLARIVGGLGTGHHLLLRRPNDGTAELTGRSLDWTSPLTAARRRAGHRQVRRRRNPAPGPIRSGYTVSPPDASGGDTTRTFIAQLHLPPGTRRWVRAMDERGWATYLNAPDGSWAEIGHRTDHVSRHPIREVGPGRLAEALERANVEYDELGRPAWTDLGVAATADGSRVWHGDPVTGRSWPLSSAPAHSS